MVSFEELKEISQARIKDARILLSNKSYDGALYLCGYAVETALKAIICKNLNPLGRSSVSHIPSTAQEFNIIASIKIHDLEKLLNLVPVNIAMGIKTDSKHFTDWSTIQKWNPEMRYAPIRGDHIEKESTDVVEAASQILSYLWGQI